MKSSLSKTEAKQKIESFFQQSSFKSEQVKKIKRLAMKHKIRLGPLRKNFCKYCLSQLKGKIHISSTHKTVTCSNCQTKNRFRL